MGFAVRSVWLGTAAAIACAVMLAYHSGKHTKDRGLLEGGTLYVATDSLGDHTTVPAATDAVLDSWANIILTDKDFCHEVISVLKDKSWLTI